MHVGNIHVEGTVSQILRLSLSSYFMQKQTGNFLYIFFLNVLSRIYRKRTRAYRKKSEIQLPKK